MSAIFKTQGGSGGFYASIFVKGLSENDTVTASNGSKTKRGVWAHRPNSEWRGLPEGYTQISYIESTGTQYIDTGVSGGTNAAYEITFNPLSANVGYEMFFAGDIKPSVPKIYRVEAKDVIAFQSSSVSSGEYAVSDSPYTVSYAVTGTVTFGGETVVDMGCAGNGWGGATWWVFNAHGEPNLFATMRLYSLKMWADGTLARDFVPVRRNSDNVVGLYDLANDVFYTNAGTGAFIAGAEISQYIYGHEISKIGDLGMWTVTATNGEKTATQDVLVDVATEYEIEIDL